MMTFDIDPAEYYSLACASPLAQGAEGWFFTSIERSRQSIGSLIERYSIAGQSVLSLGPSWGHEEHWMWKAGCRLTLIDMNRGVLAVLRDCKPGDGLRFIVGDAFAWSQQSDDTFDAIYCGGFGPSELCRAPRKDDGSLITAPDELKNYPWDAETPFYHEPTLALVGKHLKPGGLYLSQSFYPRPALNDDIIATMARQLADAGWHLLEIHALSKLQPHIHLDAIVREEDAEAWLERLAGAPPLTAIFGRGEPRGPVVRLYG